ncbi:TetR/AcrR family transcriptional regulator [Brachybacterium sp. AOP43-C2-M15]|uniref:TetR/AcrR family transcriptional regulator n=1 Tax=Brachybacterium sp. AOP43-C2-M15 TaxID=3457661 RepID=UPI004034A14F
MARTVDPVKHAERRSAILDAAARLIAAQGYEALTIADVLVEAEVSKGALYHYFAGKEELLVGVIERRIDAWGTAIDAAVARADDPGERLVALVRALVTAKTEDLTLLLGAMPQLDASGNAALFLQLRRAASERFLPLIVTAVAEGIENGEFRAESAQSAAKVVLSLLHEMSVCATRGLLAVAAGEDAREELRTDMRAYAAAIPMVLGSRIDPTRLLETAEIDGWIDAVLARLSQEG